MIPKAFHAACTTRVVFFIIYSKYDCCQIVNMDPGCSLGNLVPSVFNSLQMWVFQKIISLYFATNCEFDYFIDLLKVCGPVTCIIHVGTECSCFSAKEDGRGKGSTFRGQLPHRRDVSSSRSNGRALPEVLLLSVHWPGGLERIRGQRASFES